MANRLTSFPALIALGGAVASAYIRLVYATSRITTEPRDIEATLFSQHPQIIALWHGQFLMMPKLKPNRPADVACMVARHGDGELIGAVLKRFGMWLIRGAGAGTRRRNRGGATALRGAHRALENGTTVAMTADIPPGPARRAGEGIATLAKLSGRPVVPCAMATSRFFALSTWSAFTINLPFSRFSIVLGELITVPADADQAGLEAARLAIETELANVTERAYALVGAADPLSASSQADRSKPGFALRAYRGLTRLAAPLAPLMLAWRTRRGKEEPGRRPERYGIAGLPRPPGFLAWFHAASVGETNAVLPVIEALASDHPEIRVLLTTGTVTSAKLARARLPDNALHQYVPLDGQIYVARFLDHWRPDLGIFVESEIWPNLVLETKARQVPLLLINGRISSSSFRRWRKRPSLSRPLFGAFSLVLAQNDTLAQRFAQLGARETRGVGNLKADAPPPPADISGKKRLAAALAGRSLLLAASTHPGEEEVVAAAHRQMKQRLNDLLTIIVPRHPERGPAIAKQLVALGLSVALRSEGALPGPETEIYIADTIGEVGMFYSLASVAFVGGSLVPHGGQNPVEPIKLGAAVLTGPHFQNFRDAYDELLRVGGCRQVSDAASLAEAALMLLMDRKQRETTMRRAERAVAGMSGALPRTLAELERFLPPRPSLQHAS